MNAALNGLGNQLFGWFSQLSIELAALAVLVLVACRLLPIKSPALRHLLWVVVLLKPLVALYAIHAVGTVRGSQLEYPRILACRAPNGLCPKSRLRRVSRISLSSWIKTAI